MDNGSSIRGLAPIIGGSGSVPAAGIASGINDYGALLQQFEKGSIIRGVVKQRLANNTVIISTQQGNISIQTDIVLPKGADISFKIEQYNGRNAARIVTVNGQSLANYLEKYSGVPQDQIATSSALATRTASSDAANTGAQQRQATTTQPTNDSVSTRLSSLSNVSNSQSITRGVFLQSPAFNDTHYRAMPEIMANTVRDATSGTSVQVRVLQVDVPNQPVTRSSNHANTAYHPSGNNAPAAAPSQHIYPPISATSQTSTAIPSGTTTPQNQDAPVQSTITAHASSTSSATNATPATAQHTSAPTAQAAFSSQPAASATPLPPQHISSPVDTSASTIKPPASSVLPSAQVASDSALRVATPEAQSGTQHVLASTNTAVNNTQSSSTIPVAPAPASTASFVQTSLTQTPLPPANNAAFTETQAKQFVETPNVRSTPLPTVQPTVSPATTQPLRPTETAPAMQARNASTAPPAHNATTPASQPATPPLTPPLQQAASMQPNITNTPLITNETPLRFQAVVVNNTHPREVTLQSAFGTFKLFVPTALPKHSIITLDIVSASQVRNPINTASPSPPTINMQALEDIIPLAHTTIATPPGMAPPSVIPQLGPQLSTQLIFLLSALKGGDVGNWLGDYNVANIRTGKDKGLFSQITREMAQFASPPPIMQDNQWYHGQFPLLAFEQMHVINYSLKHQKHHNKDTGEDSTADHFMVQLELSQLGHMTLDGLIQKQPHNTQFDLQIITLAPWSDDIQRDISEIFYSAQDITGFHGTLRFEHGQSAIAPLPGSDGNATSRTSDVSATHSIIV